MAKGQIKQAQANTTYIVYMHITPNNKKYIGITKEKNPRERWRKGKGYWTNEHFTSAINKYGWDNIQHIILYKELLKEEAENKEKELIEKYNTTDREYGYNIEKGGCLNKEVSQETREKLREVNKKTKRVNQYSTDGKYIKTFNSFREVAEMFNVTRQNIYAVCSGRRKTACGFIWRYADEESR